MKGGRYIDILGHSTWIAERGEGAETLVLLHGGLAHSDMLLDTIGAELSAKYRIVAADRPGHGYTADDGLPLSYPAMGAHVVALLEFLGGAPKTLIGWSDGGTAALHAALLRQDLIKSMVLIGAKFHCDGAGPSTLERTNPLYLRARAEYGARSPDGETHFHEIAERIFPLWASEPRLATTDLAQVGVPVLVMAGDRDVVKPDHVVDMFEALPDAKLAIVPDASHGLPIEKPRLTAQLILDFLELKTE